MNEARKNCESKRKWQIGEVSFSVGFHEWERFFLIHGDIHSHITRASVGENTTYRTSLAVAQDLEANVFQNDIDHMSLTVSRNRFQCRKARAFQGPLARFRRMLCNAMGKSRGRFGVNE